MRRLQLGLLGAGLPFFALSLAIVGCGTPTTPTGGEGPPSSQKTDTKVTWIDPGKGVITGKVTLKGDKPSFDKENADITELIKKLDAPQMCKMGATKEELEQQSYRIGKDNGVANVFVWVMPAEKNTFFRIVNPEKWAKEVFIHQPHCAFQPHALIAFPEYHDPGDAKGKLKPTGQKVIADNTAEGSHNTNYKNIDGSGDNKILQKGQTMELKGLITSYKEPVRVRCNIHGWMEAYVWCFDHPYAAVTDADGTFKIEDVPTTGKLKIVAWHEKAAFLNSQAGEDIEVKVTGETTKNFDVPAPK